MTALDDELGRTATLLRRHIIEMIYAAKSGHPGSALSSADLVTVLYYVVPNLERFNFRTEVVHDLPIPPAAVGWAIVYASACVAVLLFLAALRFQTKDLK